MYSIYVRHKVNLASVRESLHKHMYVVQQPNEHYQSFVPHQSFAHSQSSDCGCDPRIFAHSSDLSFAQRNPRMV